MPVTVRKLVLTTEPNGCCAPLRPGITVMLRTHPSRPATPLFLMNTQCPAVMSVCGPQNQPVPIHWEPSLAVMRSEQCTRHGYDAVVCDLHPVVGADDGLRRRPEGRLADVRQVLVGLAADLGGQLRRPAACSP